MEILNKIGVTVIICCHNSALRLPKTLLHLSRQQLHNKIDLQIIIVNNASTDNTSETAITEWNKYIETGFDFHVIDEPLPGLIHARKTGVEHAKFECIIFCDDDNWLADNYLSTASLAIYEKENVGAVGGFGFAVSDVAFPDWFEEHISAFAVGKQDVDVTQPPRANYLWGAGLVTKKSLFIRAYSELDPFLTGRQGDNLSSGEDAEYTMRLLLMGYELLYNSELVYKHYISPSRLTIEYRKKLFKEGADSSKKILSYYQNQIEISKLNGSARIRLTCLSVIRYLLFIFRKNKRQRILSEKINIYILTGLKLGQLPLEVIQINNLKKNR